MISGSKEGVPLANSTTDPRRDLVDRIVASPIFSKSERLTSLLIYVCDIALSGREAEISEQKIGAALFGRSADYDSSIDGIVRTQASRLRQKLDLYFEGEGSEEPVRIVIPKGGYVPFFIPCPPKIPTTTVPSISPPPPATTNDEAEEPSDESSWKSWLPWGVVAILGLIIVGMLFLLQGALRRKQVIHPLWSQMFDRDQPTSVVTGDSGLVMWHGVTGKGLGLSEYISGGFRTESSAASEVPLIRTSDLATRRYTSIVDLEIVHALDQLADRGPKSLVMRYARDVRPNDFRQGNVIFIGATEANPWVEMYEPRMNFTFFNDRVHQIMSVLNRNPKDQEPERWNSDYADVQHRVYGVVAFLPNLSGNGNALILEGTSMAGTESAWDFVSDDAQLLPLLNRIRHVDGRLPHFEVVLGTNNFSGSAAKTSIVAWRTSD